MSCQLIVYGGGGDGVFDDDDDVGGRIGGGDCSWAKRTDPVLDSVSDSYFIYEISVGDSRPSSCPAYTVYWLPDYWLLP